MFTVLGTAAIGVASAGILGLAVVLPFLVKEFSFGAPIAGLLMPIVYLGCICTTVSGGRLADRWGGERTAALGMVLLVVGVLICCAAPHMPVYFAGALVSGMGYGIVNPATSLLVDPGTGGGRGAILGIKQAGVTVGGVMAGWILPTLSIRFDWRVALAFVAALQLITCLLLLIVPRVAVAANRAPASSDDSGYRLRPFPGSLYGAGMAAAQVSIFGLLVVYLTQLGQSPVSSGLLYGAALALAVIARVVWGVVSDRVPADRTIPLRWCAVIGAVGSILLAVPWVGFAVAAAVMVGLGAAAWNGAYLASVISSATKSGQGASIGRALLLINVGCVVGPLVASGILALTHEWYLVWVLMALLQVGSLIAVNRATVPGLRLAQA